MILIIKSIADSIYEEAPIPSPELFDHLIKIA